MVELRRSYGADSAWDWRFSAITRLLRKYLASDDRRWQRQPFDAVKDRFEQVPRDSHLRQLKRHVLGVPSDLGTDLHQLFPQRCQRPVLHVTGQGQSPQEVAQVTVVHLAAITNAAGSFGNATEVERVNLSGTERVARACAEMNCRLIALSTTSVYGVSSGVVDENCPPEQLKPQSPYAESKLQSERLLAELARTDSLKSVICRFGTIYGTSPGMRFHTAVNKFAWQACLGKPLTVWRAALDQQRPYLELGDAVRAIKLLLNTDDDGFDNSIYNVLTENATVRKVVACIRRFVPAVVVEEVDSQIMNQLSYTVSSEKFRSRGFTSRGNMQTGIRETIEWLRGASCTNYTLPQTTAAAS